MNTRRLLSAFSIALISLSSFTVAGKTARTTSIKASDPRITYIGRTQVKADSVSFDWTGVYARIRFQGSCLSLKVTDTGKNYYNVWLDGNMADEPDKIINTAKDTTIVIFNEDELKARFGKDKKALEAPHQVVLQKRTEGGSGRTTFIELTTTGEFLQADAPKERTIEFIGDSFTCGVGTENSVKTDPFKAETENHNKTYACIVARYFGADEVSLAHSGMGVARNFNSGRKDAFMPDLYLRTFDEAADPVWNPSDGAFKPSLTVIYLGTNDFSRGMQPSERLFVKGYINLMKEIKSNYGENHPILCVAPRNDIMMFDYIRQAFNTCGLENIHIMALTKDVHNDEEDMGAISHPNFKGQTKKAYAIIPYIATIMGWDMDGNDSSLAAGMQNKDSMEEKNPTIEAIMSRTSIRKYTDEAISDTDMETILRAGMAAPSCCNIQPWHFIVVKDQAVRQQMTDSIGPAQPAAKAQAVIVVCGDMKIMEDSPVKDNMDYWVCDACAASENILIAANALGLGGVWMGVWPMKNRIRKIQSILGLPDNMIPLNMIALGHPAERPKPKDKWKPERIHLDKF